MQKWEYIVVGELSIGYGRVKVDHPSAYHITNKGFELMTDFKDRLKEEYAENLVGQFIAQLGAEGWEIIGMGNTKQLYHCIYFKRPVP